MQGEEAAEIRGQLRDGVVTGVDERAGRGPADPDTVEDGSAILGAFKVIRDAAEDWDGSEPLRRFS